MNPTDIHGREIQVGDKVTTGNKRRVRGYVRGFDGTAAIVDWSEEFHNWDTLIEAALLESSPQPARRIEPEPEPEIAEVAASQMRDVAELQKTVEKPKAHVAHKVAPHKAPAPATKGHAHPGNGKSHAKAKHGRK